MIRKSVHLGATGLLLLIGGGLNGLSAQANELNGVEQLVDEGRFVEARDTLAQWWDAEWDTASRGDRQLGIWLRALLTIDPAMAELDYRRLVVEYPGGPHSDGALLRLAQGARARGDLEEAQRYLEILLRDYPGVPNRVEAQALLTRLAAADSAMPGLLAQRIVASPESAPTDASETPPAPATTPPAPSQPEPTATPANSSARTVTGPFTIQLGAFSTEARALSLAERAREAQLDIRVVRVDGSRLARVRLGGFMTRDDAEVQADEIRALGFEAVVSSDRERETDIP